MEVATPLKSRPVNRSGTELPWTKIHAPAYNTQYSLHIIALPNTSAALAIIVPKRKLEPNPVKNKYEIV